MPLLHLLAPAPSTGDRGAPWTKKSRTRRKTPARWPRSRVVSLFGRHFPGERRATGDCTVAGSTDGSARLPERRKEGTARLSFRRANTREGENDRARERSDDEEQDSADDDRFIFQAAAPFSRSPAAPPPPLFKGPKIPSGLAPRAPLPDTRQIISSPRRECREAPSFVVKSPDGGAAPSSR